MAVMNDGQEPRFPAAEYEGSILDVARHEQAIGEDLGHALARVMNAGNPKVEALHFASQRVQDRARASGGMSKAQAEEGMFDLAKREARQGESVAVTFSRLLAEDPRMAKLYDEGERADRAEERELVEKREDKVWPLIVESARHRRREGESIEKAVARLLTEDPVVRNAYAYAQGL
ncbi:MAG: hypothetical protein NTY35_16775 [Planctomycetota bacterium]|nr:hypothetical protein [Planctomycetota bacterium]